MCTVSFIPVKGKVFITHNRDEKVGRPKALYPEEYNIGGHKLLFPRDTAAGGSWFGVNQNGSAAVLLNGGFTKHLVRAAYRKSRGLVFLDILAADHLLSAYQKIDLANIEPFTVILWNEENLLECRWDGTRKYIKELEIYFNAYMVICYFIRSGSNQSSSTLVRKMAGAKSNAFT